MIELRTVDGTVVRYLEDPCEHPDAVPVDSVFERVAWLCPDCDAQLPAKWAS